MGKKKYVAQKQKSKVISLKMDATFFFERAVQSLDRYHYDKALKYFRLAVEYEPDNAVNHCNLAGILSEIGNYEDSNSILRNILDKVDPTMTECYFYMSNNFANMEDYESAEKALIEYLEKDPSGQYLEEAGEMMELLSYELDRPTPITGIKSREGWFEHDRARGLLEEGKFIEAVKILEKLVKRYPDFIAAHNNLALAYYYMSQFDQSMNSIKTVLEADSGNLHALCNLAIFYQHFNKKKQLEGLLDLLRKMKPFHADHVFKLATTMGILGEHETAYHLFNRLVKKGEMELDPSLFHYAAVAAYNSGKTEEAGRYWRQAEKLDPSSEIPRFFLSQMKRVEPIKRSISYHYHLPFEEQFRKWEVVENEMPEHLKRDPLIRSSFFWALQNGDTDTKLQVIQALGEISDKEVEEALRTFLMDPKEDDYLKKVAIFVLRSMGAKKPLQAKLEGKELTLHSSPFSPQLPVWESKWLHIMELALNRMDRYDMIQKYDLETLWVEYLSRVYPQIPKIGKLEGWAAALEYLTAKMHRRAISYNEVAHRYGVSITTVSKNVKQIDQACGLKEKMNAVFFPFTHNQQTKN